MAFDFDKASGGSGATRPGSNLPNRSGNGGASRNPIGSDRYGTGNTRDFDPDGFKASSIPWKWIVYGILLIAAVSMVLVFWDDIVYMIYKILSLVITIAVICIVLRLIFFRRRR